MILGLARRRYNFVDAVVMMEATRLVAHHGVLIGAAVLIAGLFASSILESIAGVS